MADNPPSLNALTAWHACPHTPPLRAWPVLRRRCSGIHVPSGSTRPSKLLQLRHCPGTQVLVTPSLGLNSVSATINPWHRLHAPCLLLPKIRTLTVLPVLRGTRRRASLSREAARPRPSFGFSRIGTCRLSGTSTILAFDHRRVCSEDTRRQRLVIVSQCPGLPKRPDLRTSASPSDLIRPHPLLPVPVVAISASFSAMTSSNSFCPFPVPCLLPLHSFQHNLGHRYRPMPHCVPRDGAP